jgi:hypothetical protein
MAGREESRLNLRPRLAGAQHAAPLQRQLPHAFVVGAAAFGDNPIDNLAGAGDVEGFAVDAVGGVDF